jgi:hypothetical protein
MNWLYMMQDQVPLLRTMLAGMVKPYLGKNPTASSALELIRKHDQGPVCYDHFAFRTFGVISYTHPTCLVVFASRRCIWRGRRAGKWATATDIHLWNFSRSAQWKIPGQIKPVRIIACTFLVNCFNTSRALVILLMFRNHDYAGSIFWVCLTYFSPH